MINPASLTDADIVALWQSAGQSCVQVFFIRGGRNNGNRAHFPSTVKSDEPADVLAPSSPSSTTTSRRRR